MNLVIIVAVIFLVIKAIQTVSGSGQWEQTYEVDGELHTLNDANAMYGALVHKYEYSKADATAIMKNQYGYTRG